MQERGVVFPAHYRAPYARERAIKSHTGRCAACPSAWRAISYQEVSLTGVLRCRVRRWIERARRLKHDCVKSVVRRHAEQRVIRRQRELVRDRHGLDDRLGFLMRIARLAVQLVIRRQLEAPATKDPCGISLRDQRNQRGRIEAAAGRREEWVANGIRPRATGRGWVPRPTAGWWCKCDVPGERVARGGVVVVGNADAAGRERTLRAKDRVLVPDVDRHREVPALGGHVANTDQRVHSPAASARMLRKRTVGADLRTFVISPKNEVHDAGDGLAAVNGRSAILQDLNTFDGSYRDQVDVNRRAVR